MPVFLLRRPGEAYLRALLDRCASAAVTYSEVGATRDPTLPSGYTYDWYRVDLGAGAFDRGRDGLRTWQAHLGAGVDVFPAKAPIAVDTDVIVSARAGPAHALAPCRVVYVIDEPDRFGFAYGTLPGHPECGEEAFIVERDAEDHATFSIIAFSKPAALLARLGKPVARSIQRRTTRAYLDALNRYAVNESFGQ
jgi:uncharacterized protein (UPF0548 family)